MQVLHGDATDMVKSLDYPYFFDHLRPYVVTEKHQGHNGELDLQVMKLAFVENILQYCTPSTPHVLRIF